MLCHFRHTALVAELLTPCLALAVLRNVQGACCDMCVFSSTGVKWCRMEAACELSVGLHNKPRYFSQLGCARFSVLLQLTVRWCERYCHVCASGGNPFHVVHLFALDVKNAAPHFTWLWMGMTGPCCWPPFCILTVVSRLCFTGSFLEGGGMAKSMLQIWRVYFIF